MAVIIDGTTGITSPAESVLGNLNFTGTGNRITGDFSNATVANRVAFQNSVTNGNTSVGAIPNGTSVSSNFTAFAGTDSSNTSFARMRVDGTSAAAIFESGTNGTGTNLPMAFNTGGSERIRIDTSGNVGIGTSSPTNGKLEVTHSSSTVPAGFFRNTSGSGDSPSLTVQGGANNAAPNFKVLDYDGNTDFIVQGAGNVLFGTTGVPDGTSIYGSGFIPNNSGRMILRFATSATATNQLISFHNPNGQVGNIASSGSSTTYVTSSDYRLKENIQPMQNALGVVAQLKAVTYKWKVDGTDGQGFIAHELADVVPDCVQGEKDAVDAEGNPQYQGIDTSFLVATLTAAIQELKLENDAFKARLDAAGL